jgi:hypothetical protein
MSNDYHRRNSAVAKPTSSSHLQREQPFITRAIAGIPMLAGRVIAVKNATKIVAM